jgi:uncharacterized RDD family membrane protein YckC
MSQTAPSPPARPQDRWVRSVVTPEGVDLHLTIATMGERAAAFLVDLVIMLAVLIGFSILIGVAFVGSKGKGSAVYAVVWLLGFFALRNAYFIAFEMGLRAATPGKRAQGLRVASRSGGRLTAEAVFARNAMRELEFFLPLSALAAQSAAAGGEGAGALAATFGLVWAGIFAFFPLFNRDRLRVGDLVAGTWVVKAPKVALLADLSALPTTALGQAPRLAFSQTQLAAYGVKELYVLEDVLRGRDAKLMRAVAERIRRKIEWPGGPGETDATFLGAYYAALRGRLEHRLLFGHRRADKFDKA